ncbi:MAG: M20/M25/M40 family metallo-hydrolase [Akkermansiaceae bacterium]
MKKSIICAVVVALAVVAGWYFLSDKSTAQGRSARAHTEEILKFGPRHPESEGIAKSRAYIAAELNKHGWQTVEQTAVRDTPEGKVTFVNLIARYQKEPLTMKAVESEPVRGILCAHLDSKKIPGIPDFLGADDAASACALIIELAKTLAAENADLAGKLELAFFDGEEAFGSSISRPDRDPKPWDGLYGSRAYSVTLYNRKPKPEFGILLDMVGHKNLRVAVPSDSPPHLRDAMNAAAKKTGHEKNFGVAGAPIVDDHVHINRAGVPCIDLIGANFAHSDWWHQEGDNIDLISAESLSISHDVTLAMLRDLLSR